MRIATTAASLAALLLALSPLPAAAQGIRIGTTTQLLLDDHVVESAIGLRTVQNKPVQGTVAIAADQPWEQRVFYPTVIKLGEHRYRMFYNAGLMRDPTFNLISVAESTDGVTFTKPRLSLFDEGGARTNIVYRDAHGPSFAYDPGDKTGRRYRMAFFGPNNGMAVAFSGDGTRFTPGPANPALINKADTQQSIVWDPAIRKWVWFTRMWEKPEDGRGAWTGFNHEIRAVARSESADFVHWSPLKTVIRRGTEDPAMSDFYGLQVTMRHGVMIGLLWTSEWYDDRGRVGLQRAQLVVSRDSGNSWTRIDAGDMFFDLGAPGSFDSKIVWPSSIVSRGDRDLIYYIAANKEHGADKIEEFPRDKYRIGVRAIGRDRFVARAAGSREGLLSTRAILMPAASALHVNAKVAAGGYVKVWITDEQETRLGDRSLAVTGDRVDGRVAWPKGGLRRLAGRTVRLHFAMKDAELYTFEFR